MMQCEDKGEGKGNGKGNGEDGIEREGGGRRRRKKEKEKKVKKKKNLKRRMQCNQISWIGSSSGKRSRERVKIGKTKKTDEI